MVIIYDATTSTGYCLSDLEVSKEEFGYSPT